MKEKVKSCLITWSIKLENGENLITFTDLGHFILQEVQFTMTYWQTPTKTLGFATVSESCP